MSPTRVYFEVGTTSVFAAAIEWPGWCRRAKTKDLALDALLQCQDRYGAIVTSTFKPGKLDVVGEVRGNSTTDFGAPGVDSPWDGEALSPLGRKKQISVLVDSWNYFDSVVKNATPRLAKGPRGGGRDRDEIVDHVREAERHYCSKLGTRVGPRTPWREQRDIITATLLAGAPESSWPPRYAIRRLAWHVVDHAWEIEDKSG
ncbi:MAG: hypothetical protein ABI298_06335 [Acidimicrobiales bacterium]